MPSKDIKPKQRLGQSGGHRRKRIIVWTVLVAAMAGGGYAAYRYGNETTKVEVMVAKVRKADFIISVRTRGEVKSVRSEVLTAPQVPDVRIVKLADGGKMVHK